MVQRCFVNGILQKYTATLQYFVA